MELIIFFSLFCCISRGLVVLEKADPSIAAKSQFQGLELLLVRILKKHAYQYETYHKNGKHI